MSTGQIQITPWLLTFLLLLSPSVFSIASPSLFLPLPPPPLVPAFVRAHPSNGLTFVSRPSYGTALTGSGGSEGLSDAGFFVAALVAWPVVGGVGGEKIEAFTGVIISFSSSGSVTSWS